jgi:hypothetical protein
MRISSEKKFKNKKRQYKAYQLLAHGRWFFPGIPASSTTKTGRHDIAEILLKVALKHYRTLVLTVLFIFK